MSGTRRREIALAGHTGDEASARAALTDDDPAVRATALGALVRLGAASAADVVRALRDADPEVRRRAAEDAARAGVDVGDALVDTLRRDGDVGVVEAAAFALGELDPPTPGAVDALAAAAAHEDVLVREAAVAAIGSIGDPAGLPAVLRATEDVATVRRRAVLALSAFDDPAVEEALQRLATDRDRHVRQSAEDLLHGWGSSD
jgi:HEAT repeat protein